LINEDIDPSITDETEPLTTIAAIKCTDGIVMASDSQATVRDDKTKILGVTKIFNINNFMGVGGSGDADNVKLFVENLIGEFPQMLPAEGELRDKIQNLTWRLHEKYNLDAREFLGNVSPFEPNVVVGVKIADGSFGLYLVKKNGIVYPKNEHVVIGSGGDLARLVIKQLNRSMAIVGGSLYKLPVIDAVKISCYIINEVKESDSQSGGQTKVVVIDNYGVRELSADEVKKNYDEFVSLLAEGFSPIFQGRSKDEIKKMWPEG
jgi:20S proteasome alpha/beta subunit